MSWRRTPWRHATQTGSWLGFASRRGRGSVGRRRRRCGRSCRSSHPPRPGSGRGRTGVSEPSWPSGGRCDGLRPGPPDPGEAPTRVNLVPDQPSAASDRPRLLLLDGHSLAYRAFFALPVENFSTTTGQHTNAVYGFTSMLINVLRDEQPTHIGVAFDVSRQTFRSEEYSDYKANRSKSPDEFSGQVSLVKEVLGALRIATIEKDGYEADDVIATLTTQAIAQGFEVLICTGDRDSFQLVGDSCTILYPRKGVSDLARMTPAAVQERYGVPPFRYPEIAALVGESSDNLPGVPGVGPKTAAKWINAYDGLDNVIANADKIKGKAGDSFREHLGD